MERAAKLIASPRVAALAASAGAAAIAALRTRHLRLSLAGKAVVIVGGSRGLGLQIAREAARRGARIGICARQADELDVARGELTSRGAVAVTAICDVDDDASVMTAFERMTAELGTVDVLINAAGIIGVGPIDALTFADFQAAMETNFFGALRATYAVLPGMRERRAGRIVNITSIGGAIAVPHLLPYCASKFAFLGFSEGLRAELARDGITVVTVIPGLMRTGSPPHATFIGQSEKEYALFSLADATPLTSVSVEHAARVILNGTEKGSARVIVSWQAKLALRLQALAPPLVRAGLMFTGFVLPRGGDHPEHKSGARSETPLTRSVVTAASQRASQTHNENVHPE
ncbi:MAG: SDR family oxidoreductase [Candidatus Eremiobacteraeota bacterium]|nr:SDR family oxidoreductase [Candidatus Eremiobacteraeota bacterium]MBC5802440.1 SDR family oxidoreductase [Candidatus Eremiobacteraeota bacterium]MBC5822893.1 SDR family oxidoreductase [Candidatus Eremiobacteraeota bacterium]